MPLRHKAGAGSRKRIGCSATIRSILSLFVLGIGITSCNSDGGADGDGLDSASIQRPLDAVDTPSVPVPGADAAGATEGAGVSTPESEARRQMQEKFDTMGGMDGVKITFTAPNAVILEGTVPSADRKQTAEDVARAVPGITQVENRIEVSS